MTVGANELLRAAHTAEIGDKLDINLLTGLIRWVGSAKGRLGVRQTATLLDVYRLTGHLTPLVDKAIHGLASLGRAADELAQHAPTTEDLVEAVLSLHGIIYGSGRPPAGPAVDFDPSEMSTWEDMSSPAEAPEELDATTEDSSADDVSRSAWAGAEPPATTMPSTGTPGELSSGGPPSEPSEYEQAVSNFREAMLWGSGDGRRSAAPSPSKTDADPPEPVTVRLDAHADEEAMAHQSKGRQGVNPVQKGPIEGVAASAGSEGPRTRFASDLTDPEWHRIAPLIPPVKSGGRPSKYERREILNAILYQHQSGCSWRTLP